MKNSNSLVDQCCKAHGMSLSDFAKHFNLSEPTLKNWRKKLPNYGKLLLESLMRIQELERKTKLLDDMANYFNGQKR